MSDQFGFLEGAKSFSESVKTGKEAGKAIGSSIEDVQKEAASVAQQKALERRRQIREVEVVKEQYFKRAMIQWQKQEEIRVKEEQVKKDFVKHHGQKRWSEVETIKSKIEKQEKEIENERNTITYKLDPEETRALKEWQKHIKAIYGTYGDYIYTFESGGGIGTIKKVWSKLANTELDLTDVKKW